MRISRFLISVLILASGSAFSLPVRADVQDPVYKLNLSSGRLPANVKTENANGVMPYVGVYDRGFTKTGWTVDRLGSRGYVAVTPTFNENGEACENILSLPSISVPAGAGLAWSAQSVYNHFPESYRVDVTVAENEDPVTVFEIEEESRFMTLHTVDLDQFAGKDVTIRFVCTSTKGYLLALTDVVVATMESLPQPDVKEPEPLTPFSRRYLVDKATGMWCVNCPEGEVAIDALEEQWGERVIPINTHVRDELANTPYWDALKWNSVPRLMLNRIRATEGNDTKNFEKYFDEMSQFAVSLDEIAEPSGSTLDLHAKVMVAEPIDNADGRYRLGYVLTGDFHDPMNPAFAQQNNCNMPWGEAYYYLPSTILPVMMYYENVSLTIDGAFDGIADSLPSVLEPGATYDVSWSADVPELLADPSKARVVAYVLDTVSGDVMNATALRVGEDPFAGVEAAIAEECDGLRLSIAHEGVKMIVPEGMEYTVEAYAADGVQRFSKRGFGEGFMIVELPEAKGLNIIILSTPVGQRVCKAIF